MNKKESWDNVVLDFVEKKSQKFQLKTKKNNFWLARVAIFLWFISEIVSSRLMTQDEGRREYFMLVSTSCLVINIAITFWREHVGLTSINSNPWKLDFSISFIRIFHLFVLVLLLVIFVSDISLLHLVFFLTSFFSYTALCLMCLNPLRDSDEVDTGFRYFK